MKRFFYILVFLFVSTLVSAQQSVNYVSFFPPANIVHTNITLSQDPSTSFNVDDARGLTENPDISSFHSKPGGLILGAASSSTITVGEMHVTMANKVEDQIQNFEVDNIIKVSGSADDVGMINRMVLGKCPEDDDGSCSTFFLSVDKVKFPSDYYSRYNATSTTSYDSEGENYPSDLTVNVMASGLAEIEGIFLGCQATSSSGGAGAASAAASCSNIIPSMNSGDKLTWVNLRLLGTEECRKYLVKYQGSDVPQDNCFPPTNQPEQPNSGY